MASVREQEVLAGVQGAPRYAVDAVFDSVSVVTTFKKELAAVGVIFCPISEAIREHPELVRKYLGSVVPVSDNYFACLNSAVFSDGSFVYIPPGVRCPMELSTYFRINAKDTGQFERTLIIADKGSYCSYLEGCTAPMRDENQLHAAVVELVILEDAEIKYSTVQNWYPGDPETGKGGIYNFVTKRADCREARAKVSWTQVETGSAITWKYPSCILRGEGSSGEFYSIAVTNGHQQADTGTKMIHLGANTRRGSFPRASRRASRPTPIAAWSRRTRRPSGARNFTQCDSLLIGKDCAAHTVPYIEARNGQSVFEHEATTTRLSDDQLFYCQQRGLDTKSPSPCWSTASSATCCRPCRWSSRSRRRSWWRSRWKGAWGSASRAPFSPSPSSSDLFRRPMHTVDRQCAWVLATSARMTKIGASCV